jgi:hypothetical protein
MPDLPLRTRAALDRPGEIVHSVGTPLKLPRCFEGILNSTSVTSGEVSDNHHVLDVPRRDAEGSGKLPQYRVAVVEVGTDYQMRFVKLACDQPAVISPLGQPIRHSEAHTRQGLDQVGYIIDLH